LTVVTHLAVGAAVGTLTDNPAGAAVLGLVSHVPLDLMPHYEFEKMWVEVAVVLGFFGVMLATGMGRSGIFWGALGATVPDVENLLWRLGIIPDEGKVFPGHSLRLAGFFPHGRTLGPRHALTQVAIVAASAVVVAVALTHGGG
jgi:hypothetical protein